MEIFLMMFVLIIPIVIIISLGTVIKIIYKAYKKLPEQIELYKKEKYIIEKQYKELKEKENKEQ